MSKKKKSVNKSGYPDEAIKSLARCFYPSMMEFFNSEEGQREYEEWLKEIEMRPTQNSICCDMQFAVVSNESNMRIAIVPEENEKSEPFSNWKQVRIFLVWWRRWESNL